MKLFLRISIIVLALSLGIVGLSKADTWDLRNRMDNLNSQIPFGYATTQKITVKEVTVDHIVIQSPIIQDELGNQIKKYTVMYSQYPLSQILEDTSLLSQSKEKTFDFTTVDTGITMELITTGDNLTPSSVYYLSVIPKDQNGILWEISNEIRFKLATQTFGEGNTSGATTGVHTAPGANMTLANVTHTIENNRVTLRRTAVDGSDKVDIFLWNPTSSVFERLSSVNMTDETYTFALTRNGEYIINFMPNNWGTEYRYTFTVNGVTATAGTPGVAGTATPKIGKIPKTWPKENVLVALGIAFVFYLIYRKVRSKAKQ